MVLFSLITALLCLSALPTVSSTVVWLICQCLCQFCHLYKWNLTELCFNFILFYFEFLSDSNLDLFLSFSWLVSLFDLQEEKRMNMKNSRMHAQTFQLLLKIFYSLFNWVDCILLWIKLLLSLPCALSEKLCVCGWEVGAELEHQKKQKPVTAVTCSGQGRAYLDSPDK